MTLAGCGSSTSNSSAGAATNPSSGTSSTSGSADLAQYIGKPSPDLCGGKKYNIGYDTYSDTDPFAINLYNGLKSVASTLGCVTIDKLTDNADAGQAVQNARIFAQKRVDGALLFNVISAAGPGQVQQLDAAHIPAVTIVVKAPGQTFVTNDDTEDGVMAGQALAAAYNKQKSGTPVYAIIGRFDGQGPTGIDRMDGVLTGLGNTVPKSNIFQFDSKADPPTAQAGTAAVLGKIPAGATILMTGINDPVTYAMFQAVKQAGRTGDALVSGMTVNNPSGLDFICKNSSYIGGVGFFPEDWSKYMLPALIARIRGAQVPDKIVVPTHFISRDDISKYYPDYKCAG